MYSLIRHILFKFEPEVSHKIALESLRFAYLAGFTKLFANNIPLKPANVMGLAFPNPIGLAAGLDKNGDYIDALATLGFGFIEIGTITPKPQAGNPRPRIFRLIDEEALINRMGFPNRGADYVVSRLEKVTYRGILGINIGKNKDTPNEKAIEDYLIGLQKFYPFASYLVINISSPNTEGLRDLQTREYLLDLLRTLKQEQNKLSIQYKKYVPLLVKISPDLNEEALTELSHSCLEEKIDGIIATNTTLDRTTLNTSVLINETGGLSGKPLQMKSTSIIYRLKAIVKNEIPIIGCGGIMDVQSAEDKLTAGASLLQIYTGFIFRGPGLIKNLIENTKLDL